MTDVAAETVWKGAPALEQFLVPIDDLEPFPGNPNKGDVETIRASLLRFGQVRAIVVDDRRIVAGHHVVEGARAEGWTHVAAIPNEFADEEEARAYLLADNAIPERGVRDDELLGAQLRALADAGRSLDGIGYDEERALELIALASGPVFAPSDEEPPPLDSRSASTTGLFEVPLLLGHDGRRDFANWVATLKREWGIADTTAVVVRAVREAALRQ